MGALAESARLVCRVKESSLEEVAMQVRSGGRRAERVMGWEDKK